MTAIEWLEKRFYFTKGQLIDIDFEQAKAMEKEQIESLLEKAIQERDYYYNLWKKANAYIVKK